VDGTAIESGTGDGTGSTTDAGDAAATDTASDTSRGTGCIADPAAAADETIAATTGANGNVTAAGVTAVPNSRPCGIGAGVARASDGDARTTGSESERPRTGVAAAAAAATVGSVGMLAARVIPDDAAGCAVNVRPWITNSRTLAEDSPANCTPAHSLIRHVSNNTVNHNAQGSIL
jgi:hypothetical protein